MFASHSQVGRTRVNKIREGKKNPPRSRELNKNDHFEHIKPRSNISIPKKQSKVIGQLPKNNITGFDKLMQLQNDMIKDGLTLQEYKNYVQDKINNDKYYYKTLSEGDLSKLHQRYRKLVQNENNKYNEIGNEKEMNRKQRKLYRRKRKTVVEDKKRELIGKLFSEINKSRSIGLTHTCNHLKDDPDHWKNTKKLLFTGGRYIESHDKDWVKYYSKIVSLNISHLFDMNDSDQFYEYIINQ